MAGKGERTGNISLYIGFEIRVRIRVHRETDTNQASGKITGLTTPEERRTAHRPGRLPTTPQQTWTHAPTAVYALLIRRLLARCCAIMSAMVSASTLRGMTRSKSAAIVSSVGASPERGAAGAA